MIVDEWAKQVWQAVGDFKRANYCEVKVTIFVAIGLYQQAMSEIRNEVSPAAFELHSSIDAPTLMGFPVIKTLPDSRCQFKIVVEKA